MNQRIFIAKARSILSDNAGVRKLPHQRTGKFLDESRLGLVHAGEKRVFQKPIKRQFSEYHICILLDCSGSMQEGHESYDEQGNYYSISKLEVASMATHALAYSLELAGAKVDIIGFNSLFKHYPKSVYQNSKDFYSTNYLSASMYGGDNCDSGAVRMGRDFLQKKQAPGKIMIVLSDGAPTCRGICETYWKKDTAEREERTRSLSTQGFSDPKDECPSRKFKDKHDYVDAGLSLEKEIEITRKAGILTFAIGIMTNDPVQYYGEKNTRVVNDLNNLYSEMANVLEKNIVRG